MTIAVCLQCGKIKFGAWVRCSNCGHEPETLEDRAKHLMLSDHYYPQQQLEQFARRISQGEVWSFDEETTQRFINELSEAERQEAIADESFELIQEYRQSVDQEELEFYDSLPDYTQAVQARLWLYERYSSRVEQAGNVGGWVAAEAEFNKLLTEDPRLKPLQFQKAAGLGKDGWIVVHP